MNFAVDLLKLIKEAVRVPLSTIILVLVCITLLFKLGNPLLKKYQIAKYLEKLAGNPKLHWFYGHWTMIGKTPHDVIMTLANLSLENPLMFNIWRGPIMSTLHLYHPSVVRPLLSSSAPKDWFVCKFLRPWLGESLVTSDGVKWKRHRTILTNAFHFQILKPYMQVSNKTVQVLIDKWKKKTNRAIEISNDVSLMTLDTMVQCAMSTKTDCQLTDEKHFYVKAIDNITKGISRRIQQPLHFMDWIYRLTKAGKDFYKNIAIAHAHTEKIIRNRREVLTEKREIPDKIRKKLDFIDILLCAKDEDEKGFSDDEIRDEVETFMFAGYDTTSSGISWTLYNLARYPEFQNKCREEIMSFCEPEEDITWKQLSRLNYVTMFLKESMRLYPPVIMAARCINKPFRTKRHLDSSEEVDLPVGSSVGVNIIALHRNSCLWEDPEDFNPERFSKENSLKRSPYAYLPFSAGSRNCIGQNFAMNEMKVCLSQILRNFYLYLDDETPTPKFEARLILQSVNGIYIKLKPIDEV